MKRNHRWAQSQVIRCVIYVIRYDRNLERKKLTLSGTSREMRWKRRGWAWGAGSRWRVKTWALQSVCCIKRRICPSVTAWPWTSLWSECSCPPTPPPKAYTVKSLFPKMIFGGGSWGRYVGHEGETLINGIIAVIKEAPERPPDFPPCEDTVRQCRPWTHKIALTRLWRCWHLELGLPSLQNCRQ